jgi:hypothetical protein
MTEKSKQSKLVGIRLSQDQYDFCQKLADKLYEKKVIQNNTIPTLFKFCVTKFVTEITAMQQAIAAQKSEQP